MDGRCGAASSAREEWSRVGEGEQKLPPQWRREGPYVVERTRRESVWERREGTEPRKATKRNVRCCTTRREATKRETSLEEKADVVEQEEEVEGKGKEEGEKTGNPNQEKTETKADVEHEPRTSRSRITQTVYATRDTTTTQSAANTRARGETTAGRAMHSEVDGLGGGGVWRRGGGWGWLVYMRPDLEAGSWFEFECDRQPPVVRFVLQLNQLQ